MRILTKSAAAMAGAVLFSTTCRAADLPLARLDTIFPPGGKTGTEVEVAITGADLDEGKELHFSHPGITAIAKEKGFTVKIAADVPAGVYDVRVAGLFGISNPRAFSVGDLPQSIETSANTNLAAAMLLPIDSAIAGTATAATVDYFKLSAKQGQRIQILCEATELDSRLQPVMSVLDNANRELESGRAGAIDFTAPADGEYTIKLHDLTFAGGPEYFYRLSATTAPRLDFVLPLSGKPGTTGKFTLFGRNLPGGQPTEIAGSDGKPLQKLEVEIAIPSTRELRDGLTSPAGATVDGFSYRLKPERSSNPVFIGFADAPATAETEPNDTSDKAQKIGPPCEINGQFYPAGDADSYVFEAKKGDVFWMDVISRRLGLPTNPSLLVQRDSADIADAYPSDTNVGGAKFSTASGDPSLRFEAKEDGSYRVKVRDLFGGARKAPRNIYRFIIRKESPDFSLIALTESRPEKADDRSAKPRSAQLFADGVSALRVLALRRDGFAGEIELRAEGLPPGVACKPAKIAAGANEGVLLLSAVEKPERWVGMVRVIGKAKIGEAEIQHDARGGAVQWTVGDTNTEPLKARLSQSIALALSPTDAAPLSIRPADEKPLEVITGAKLDIPLKVTRRGEFKEALKLKIAGAPGIETVKEFDLAPDAAAFTASIDTAAAKLPAGTHTLYFSAQTKGKFRGKDVVTTIYSAPVSVTIQAPPPPAPPTTPAAAPAPAK